jgi:hypothetical protein
MYPSIVYEGKGSTAMTAYERQIKETEAYYDAEIAIAERDEIEILNSVVSGSRLHEILHNPHDEGIDEG